MIDSNILNILKTNFQDPSYSVIISGNNQTEFCNKDQLDLIVEQISPNLESIIENKNKNIERLKKQLEEHNIPLPNDFYDFDINSRIEKTLRIESFLDYKKDDQLYVSRLSGTLYGDTDIHLNDRYLEGKIVSNSIKITKKDVPNYFARSRFTIQDGYLNITIPKKVEDLNIKVTKRCKNTQECVDSEDVYTMDDVVKNKVKIYLNNEFYLYSFSIRYTLKKDLFEQKIESIITPLKKNISLEFANKYSKIPSVIITVDEDNKKYSSYNTSFLMDMDGNYSGVDITFNSLRRQRFYDDINITIIGLSQNDIQEETEDESSTDDGTSTDDGSEG